MDLLTRKWGTRKDEKRKRAIEKAESTVLKDKLGGLDCDIMELSSGDEAEAEAVTFRGSWEKFKRRRVTAGSGKLYQKTASKSKSHRSSKSDLGRIPKEAKPAFSPKPNESGSKRGLALNIRPKAQPRSGSLLPDEYHSDSS